MYVARAWGLGIIRAWEGHGGVSEGPLGCSDDDVGMNDRACPCPITLGEGWGQEEEEGRGPMRRRRRSRHCSIEFIGRLTLVPVSSPPTHTPVALGLEAGDVVEVKLIRDKVSYRYICM